MRRNRGAAPATWRANRLCRTKNRLDASRTNKRSAVLVARLRAFTACVGTDGSFARWRGDVGSSWKQRNQARVAENGVKNCRVHPTHWLISAQFTAVVLLDILLLAKRSPAVPQLLSSIQSFHVISPVCQRSVTCQSVSLPHVSLAITHSFPIKTAHRSSMSHVPPLSGMKPSDAGPSPATPAVPSPTVPAARAAVEGVARRRAAIVTYEAICTGMPPEPLQDVALQLRLGAREDAATTRKMGRALGLALVDGDSHPGPVGSV